MSKKKLQKFVTLREAIQILNEAFGNDPSKSGRNVIAIGSLYNALYHKKLKKYGKPKFRQVDVNELLEVFGPQKIA
ncbi:hypothetical protein UFOVP610_25 [uncultured Caudovirales phage]|uniref:Uncharacterized protein n=1 Tax=uncultured Caudovirales phage TaxID=2100421 RepID=A0A6J5N684_9CAUD|nr:hypothetical protein UFOVP610_25 [uncultured Caudovirales phage]